MSLCHYGEVYLGWGAMEQASQMGGNVAGSQQLLT